VVRCYFIELGFTAVDLAANGLAAWRKLQIQKEKGHAYDVVVSDWNMPKMSGLELLNCIREDTYFVVSQPLLLPMTAL
jgi:two-component system chemotaxis response regulator CheY